MKRTALALLAALAATAAADAVFVKMATGTGLARDLQFTLLGLLALGPGFVALGAVFVLGTRPFRGRAAVVAALLLVRLVAFDQLFLAPKRAELAADVAGTPPTEVYRVAKAVHDGMAQGAGLGCAAGALAAWLVAAGAVRRRRLAQTAVD